MNHFLEMKYFKLKCMPIGCGFHSTLWDEEKSKELLFSVIQVANFVCLGEKVTLHKFCPKRSICKSYKLH